MDGCGDKSRSETLYSGKRLAVNLPADLPGDYHPHVKRHARRATEMPGRTPDLAFI
mgnify:CR=1 FL=1|jgi:uncharacterized protein YktB (UPF0637 family)